MPRRRLPRSFFRRPALQVARDLLGQRLVRLDRGRRLSGWIVETEAYIGPQDLGCHARSGRTPRNRSMWGPPGHAYVYFTYGMHWCLNVVTEPEGLAAAVLIRGIVPFEGADTMRRRRALRLRSGQALSRATPEVPSGVAKSKGVADGPAKLCQALDLDRAWDGHDLCRADSRLFIERAASIPSARIRRTPRVGLDRVPEPWKSKPWRFRLAGDPSRRYPQEEPA